MLIWTASFLALGMGIKSLGVGKALRCIFAPRTGQVIRTVAECMREWRELIQAGLLPGAGHWDALKKLPKPWDLIVEKSLVDLRRAGAQLLPTIQQIEKNSMFLFESLEEGWVKSAPARFQAGVCVGMVPLFWALLYGLLPALAERIFVWLGVGLGAFVIGTFGAWWTYQLATRAAWGGLPEQRRSWVVLSSCAGERLLALLSAGLPPDLAWVEVGKIVGAFEPQLAIAWGASVWRAESASGPSSRLSQIEILICSAGDELKRAIQVSLMEGRPCFERLSAVMEGLRQGIKNQIQHEIALLQTRALKPMFLCVAPALLLLVACGIYFSYEAASRGF